MKKIVSLIFLALGLQAVAAVNADSLASRMAYQLWSYPQEKVHVVTDRGAYLSGDTILFRAFVVDAADNMPVSKSKYLYVELADPFGNTVERVKVMERDGVYAGLMPLEKELAEGGYTLSAYTMFMQNQGPDFFFRKSLPVKSIYASKYQFTPEFTLSGKDLKLTVSLTEGSAGKPVKCESLTLRYPDNTLVDAGRKKAKYTFKIPEKRRNQGVVKVTFDNYAKFIALPPDTSLLSVTFHPEGGYMIHGEMNTVAFKAIDGAGRGVDVAGTITDDSGAEVASLKSRHRGMGSVQFIPEAGRSYVAHIDGQTFELPAPEAGAAVIRVATNKPDRFTVKTAGKVPAGSVIVAHSRGRMLYAAPASDMATTVGADMLAEGIVQFMLLGPDGQVLSSRMAFVYPANHSVDARPDSVIPTAGSYAVAITANDFAVPDNLNPITAQLLLQSDLRGHIEDPAYYLEHTDRQGRADLDALLMTQGWERYNLPAAMRAEYAEPALPLEIGGEISGIIKSRWKGKPMENAQVNIIAPTMNYAAVGNTDANGHFTVNGIDWPDGTTFIIQAIGNKGKLESNFEVDKDRFPTQQPLPMGYVADREEESLTYPAEAYAIMLKEIEVSAPVTAEQALEKMLEAMGAKSYNSQYFEDNAITTYEELIRRLPSLYYANGRLRRRGRNSISDETADNVEIWVDGMQFTSVDDPIQNGLLSDLTNACPFQSVEKIEYLSPGSAVMVSGHARGGVLMITTKKSGDYRRQLADELLMRVHTPLGYQNAPEVYRPHYIYSELDTDPQRLPSAIWLPSVPGGSKIPSLPGSTTVISGITDSGKVVFHTFDF